MSYVETLNKQIESYQRQIAAIERAEERRAQRVLQKAINDSVLDRMRRPFVPSDRSLQDCFVTSIERPKRTRPRKYITQLDQIHQRDPKVVKTQVRSARQIIADAAARANLTVADLKSPSRLASVCLPRHVAMWRMRKGLSMSYPAIARMFNRTDHKAVMQAVDKIDRLFEDMNRERG